MDSSSLLILIMSSIVGGAVAWRYATANLYRRPGAEWATDTIHPKRINPRLLKRRKRHRWQIVAMTAFVTPLLVLALMVGFEMLVDVAHTR